MQVNLYRIVLAVRVLLVRGGDAMQAARVEQLSVLFVDMHFGLWRLMRCCAVVCSHRLYRRIVYRRKTPHERAVLRVHLQLLQFRNVLVRFQLRIARLREQTSGLAPSVQMRSQLLLLPPCYVVGALYRNKAMRCAIIKVLPSIHGTRRDVIYRREGGTWYPVKCQRLYDRGGGSTWSTI